MACAARPEPPRRHEAGSRRPGWRSRPAGDPRRSPQLSPRNGSKHRRCAPQARIASRAQTSRLHLPACRHMRKRKTCHRPRQSAVRPGSAAPARERPARSRTAPRRRRSGEVPGGTPQPPRPGPDRARTGRPRQDDVSSRPPGRSNAPLGRTAQPGSWAAGRPGGPKIAGLSPQPLAVEQPREPLPTTGGNRHWPIQQSMRRPRSLTSAAIEKSTPRRPPAPPTAPRAPAAPRPAPPAAPRGRPRGGS
mmetsp:Transcript_26728/g.88826  ORF Transcript_26728/g.88826 Transcript_26728/m.88826 type:complete len:248 (+) Transcript_26728:239-982(+)